MTWDVYDKEWTTEKGMPRYTRFRVSLTKRRGTPIRYLLQIEYWHAGTWLQVARSEHEIGGMPYQNAEIAGIHIDIHHPDGRQVNKLTGWPPKPANEAMGDAEDFLRNNAHRLVRRFETWL